MLVCGLQAPIEDGHLCTSIPERGAMGLDNGFLTGNQDPFHEVKRLLGVWYSQENPPAKIRPLDFIKWCQARGFDTSWLRGVQSETDKRAKVEMRAALGSGVVVLPRLPLLSAGRLAIGIAFSMVAIPDDERLVTVLKASVLKQTSAETQSTRELLTEEDWRIVRAICGNPPERCTRAKFDDWSAKFAAADNRPEWSLYGEFTASNEMTKAQARWSEVAMAHEQQIADWVSAGRLLLVTVDGVETLDLTKGFIRLADAKRYLEHCNLLWQDATAYAERSNTAPTASELSKIGLTPEVWEGAPDPQRDRILQNIARTKADSAQVAQQAIDRRVRGRYTLNEAAKEIADTGERLKPLSEKLCDAAQRGELPTYAPGESVRYVYVGGRRPRSYYEEAYWDDLNAWLERNEPRVVFRFAKPSPSEAASVEETKQGRLHTRPAAGSSLRKRSNPLTAIIDMAKREAADQNDTHSVWAALVKLASQNAPPAPLVGYADEEGVKWEAEGTVNFLTKRNLADRLRRAKPR
jgi:hypothetical protein